MQVVEGKRVQGLSVEDTVRVFIKSKSGVMGNVDLSWSINKELDSYINIYGSNGTISVGWKESKYRQSSSRDWVVFGKGYNKVQAFRSQLDNFARSIRGEDLLLITAEDALASVQVIEGGVCFVEAAQLDAGERSGKSWESSVTRRGPEAGVTSKFTVNRWAPASTLPL